MRGDVEEWGSLQLDRLNMNVKVNGVREGEEGERCILHGNWYGDAGDYDTFSLCTEIVQSFLFYCSTFVIKWKW